MDPPEVSAANETIQDSQNKEEEPLRSVMKMITGYFRSRGEGAKASGGLPWDPSANSADGGGPYSGSQEEGTTASHLTMSRDP